MNLNYMKKDTLSLNKSGVGGRPAGGQAISTMRVNSNDELNELLENLCLDQDGNQLPLN